MSIWLYIYYSIFIVGLVTLNQIFGDSILIINRIIFNRKKSNLTPVEHFIISFLLGFQINGYVSLIITRFQPFSLNVFIIINFLLISFFFLVIFLLRNEKNPKKKNKTEKFPYLVEVIDQYLIFHLIILLCLKKRVRDYKKETNYSESKVLTFYSLLSIMIGLITFVLLTYLRIISNFPLNDDIFVYIHHTLDAIRNGWNYVDPNYLGKFYSTKIFSFYLLQFISINPDHWYQIILFYLTSIQFACFFGLFASITYRITKKRVYHPYIVLFSGVYFFGWFIFFLPSNLNILNIMVVIFFLINFKKEYFSLEALFILFAALLHFPTINFVGIPFLFTFFFSIYKNRYRIKKFIKTNRVLKLFLITFIVILTLSIIVITTLFYDSILNTLDYIFNIYIKMERQQKNLSISEWQTFSIGIPLLFFIFFSIFVIIVEKIYKKKKFLSDYSIIKTLKMIGNEFYPKASVNLYILLQFLYLLIYLSNVEFWSQIIRTLYLPYRFFTWFTLSCSLIFPLLLENPSLLSIKKKIADFGISKINKILQIISQKSKYIEKNKYSLRTIIFLFILFLSLPNLINNFNSVYLGNQFARYWPTAYISSLEYGQKNFDVNSSYCFNPDIQVSFINYNFFHTYLGDRPCMELSYASNLLNDSKYKNDEIHNFTNYKIFKQNLFSGLKPVYTIGARYNTTEKGNIYISNFDYIFLDTLTNPNLIYLMLQDPMDFKIKFISQSENFGKIYRVYIFFPVNNSNTFYSRAYLNSWDFQGLETEPGNFLNYKNLIKFQSNDFRTFLYSIKYPINQIFQNFSVIIPDYSINRILHGRSNETGPIIKILFFSDGTIAFANHINVYPTGINFPENQLLNFSISWIKGGNQILYFNGKKISELPASSNDINFFWVEHSNAGTSYFLFS